MPTELLIDDAAIRSLSTNQAVLALFPFFRTMTVELKTAGCKCRRRAERVVRVPDYAGIRQTIARLGMDEKRKLKEITRAAFIVLRYRRPDGSVVRMRF
jgi:hypothetical protein